MKKFVVLAALALLLTAFTATAAFGAQTTTVNFANAPQGAHFVGSVSPTCTVTTTTVTCPSTAFDIAGVGGTNATESLTVTYSAIIDCFNGGVNRNNPVESHTQTRTSPTMSATLQPKNGRLTVTSLTSTAPSESTFLATATCPNANWTPRVRSGSITVSSFTYTLTFAGFTAPVITITGTP